MVGKYSVVGKRIPRVDSPTKVTGLAKFVTDVRLPRLLHGKVLRSPLPHARILSIDVSRAEQLSGVRAVVTARDTPRIKIGWGRNGLLRNRLPLQDENVRFIGDEIAAIAAVDEDTAEEALELIKVEFDVLAAVFDPEEAMQPGAPLVHDLEQNIALHPKSEYGNVEIAFAQADKIFEDTFRTQPQALCCLEVHGAVADCDPSGKVTVWATSQSPQQERMGIARALGLPPSKVRVINCTVGGSFGGKSPVGPGPLAAFLSMKAGLPVRLIYTREEEFQVSGHRHPAIHSIKTGVTKDGRLLARQVRTVIDCGAYHRGGVLAVNSPSYKVGQLYAIPNLRFEGFLVYTNNQPGSSFRGVGSVQIHFAMESQMDIIAKALDIDPLELRLRNANRPNTLTPSGARISTCGLVDCLQRAAATANWQGHSLGKNKGGKGMACLVHAGGGTKLPPHDTNFAEALVKVDEAGTVNVVIGEPDVGTGCRTILSMMVAEVLGVYLDDVQIAEGDTESIPLDTQGTYGSRVTFVAGNAVKKAAEEVRRQILQATAELLEAPAEDLVARDRQIFVVGSPEKSVSLTEAVHAAYQRSGSPVTGFGQFVDVYSADFAHRSSGSYTPTYSWAAQAAEVAVDTETGQVQVLKVASAHDLGLAINPMSAEGQIEGAVAMGLGYALSESLKKEAGRALNPSFTDYKLPGALDVPAISPILVETIDPLGPFGAKGLGEPGMVAIAPAIANAIYHATGIRLKELPIDPERLLLALGTNA